MSITYDGERKKEEEEEEGEEEEGEEENGCCVAAPVNIFLSARAWFICVREVPIVSPVSRYVKRCHPLLHRVHFHYLR